jgi:autotransporter translocation and assembly factor TamB
VELTAEYDVPSRGNPDQPEVTISLEVTGSPDSLNLEISSNPPLEASDMVSYLAVGQPAGRSLGGGEGSLSQTGGALALGRLSSAVEAYAREEVGLDVVEITTDGLDGLTLLAGRYISPNLYLGIRQPISLQRTSGDQAERPQEPEFEVELQAVRWLLLNLQAGGRGETKVFVRSRISYD